jgi:predicted nucleic acid binding AN1-type Zn finger protein
LVEKCSECGKVTAKNQKCEYCGKTFCEDHYSEHMAWERRHENLAEDASRLWKRKREE